MNKDRNETGNRAENMSAPRLRESRDFARGLIMGILIAGIVFLAAMLFRFGTIRLGKEEGAAVLTSPQVREKLRSVQSIIEADSLEEPDAGLLETYMFKGIAVGLDDPYAAYYNREEQEEEQKENRGAYRGIGVVFTQYEDEMLTEGGEAESQESVWKIVVTKVYEGGPAQEAGVQKGDVLLAVDGQDVTGLPLDPVMEQIGGAFGKREEVGFTFLRDKEEVLIPIREAEVPLKRVTGELAEDGIGYMMIPEFDEVTPQQFRDCLTALKEETGEEGLKGLVIDVRDNPGGDLEAVSQILDELLDECVMLTSSNAKGVQERLTAKDGKLFDGKMAVLVNGSSASAAEVFAGVLQDQGKAGVVGSTTYGKGTIQHTYKLSDGSAFKLTSEKYAIGGTKEIDGVGVTPDVEVEPEDTPVNDKSTDTAGGDGKEKEDPVLEAALDLLRAGT